MSKSNKIVYLPNINNIIQYGIEQTELISLHKTDKKTMCMNIIKTTIDNLDDNDYKLFLIACYENNTISDMVDLVIDASKGKINVNKKINLLLGCLSSVINIIKTKLKLQHK